MSTPFIAEIIMFGGNFAPRNWTFCNGQLLPISQNTAVFSLVGTTYGGDGRTTFGIPGLRGRSPIGEGRGAGLSDRRCGQRGGTQTNTLSELNLPSHTHGVSYPPTQLAQGANSGDGVDSNPWERYPATSDDEDLYANSATGVMGAGTVSAVTTVGNAGGPAQAVNNMQPWLAVNFIFCLQGTFPSRS